MKFITEQMIILKQEEEYLWSKFMEKYKEIERSIITKFRKDIWARFVKAVKEYELIKENDIRKTFGY